MAQVLLDKSRRVGYFSLSVMGPVMMGRECSSQLVSDSVVEPRVDFPTGADFCFFAGSSYLSAGNRGARSPISALLKSGLLQKGAANG